MRSHESCHNDWLCNTHDTSFIVSSHSIIWINVETCRATNIDNEYRVHVWFLVRILLFLVLTWMVNVMFPTSSIFMMRSNRIRQATIMNSPNEMYCEIERAFVVDCCSQYVCIVRFYVDLLFVQRSNTIDVSFLYRSENTAIVDNESNRNYRRTCSLYVFR
jgi:hypothetical protein